MQPLKGLWLIDLHSLVQAINNFVLVFYKEKNTKLADYLNQAEKIVNNKIKICLHFCFG